MKHMVVWLSVVGAEVVCCLVLWPRCVSWRFFRKIACQKSNPSLYWEAMNELSHIGRPGANKEIQGKPSRFLG